MKYSAKILLRIVQQWLLYPKEAAFLTVTSVTQYMENIQKHWNFYRLHTLLAETLGKIIIQKNCLKNSKKFEMYSNQLINQIAIYIFNTLVNTDFPPTNP